MANLYFSSAEIERENVRLYFWYTPTADHARFELAGGVYAAEASPAGGLLVVWFTRYIYAGLVTFACDPEGHGRWVVAPPAAADWDSNAEGTGVWAVVVGTLVGAWDCDPIGEGEWAAINVGGDAEFECDPVGEGEWIPRIGALTTPCVAGDGEFNGEHNYVF